MRRAANCDARPTGFNIAQLGVLFEVHARPGMTQQELADKLQLTKGNIAQLVEKMEGDGLVARTQQGRLKHLSLTAKGEAMMREHIERHDRFITRQLAALSEEELHQLRHLLRKLDRSLA
jgi:DNA-binding MarR family transcriptional regulator